MVLFGKNDTLRCSCEPVYKRSVTVYRILRKPIDRTGFMSILHQACHKRTSANEFLIPLNACQLKQANNHGLISNFSNALCYRDAWERTRHAPHHLARIKRRKVVDWVPLSECWSSVRSRTFGTAEGFAPMARSIRRDPCAGCWWRSAAQNQACMYFIHSCAATMDIHSLSPGWR